MLIMTMMIGARCTGGMLDGMTDTIEAGTAAGTDTTGLPAVTGTPDITIGREE